jgi:aarF domain-containing kinase
VLVRVSEGVGVGVCVGDGVVVVGEAETLTCTAAAVGVEDALTADLAFLVASTRVLEFLLPDLARGSLAAVAADLRSSMLDELDFTKEASQLRAFAAYLDSTQNASATVPFVYTQLSTRRLITMERLRGVPLTDAAALAGPASRRGVPPEELLIGALNTWAGSVLACEAFHADLHAGNLLVLADGRVAFIDFGVVGRISPGTWGSVSSLLAAAAAEDWRAAAQSMVAMGAAEAVDVDAFGRDLGALAASFRGVRASVVVQGGAASVAVDEADVNRVLLDLVRTGERHGVRFPREFGLLLKQVLYFDRYRAILAPELDVLSDPRVRLSQAQRW